MKILINNTDKLITSNNLIKGRIIAFEPRKVMYIPNKLINPKELDLLFQKGIETYEKKASPHAPRSQEPTDTIVEEKVKSKKNTKVPSFAKALDEN